MEQLKYNKSYEKNTDFITVDKAFELISLVALQFKLNLSQQSETVNLEKALGRKLSQEIIAERDQPPFHRVTMDGMALNWESVNKGNRQFKIENLTKAGSKSKKLNENDSAIECMTGAVLPDGCDMVVRYEDLEINNNTATIKMGTDLKKGMNIHFKGSDCLQGDIVLKMGSRLYGPQIGICASNGYQNVKVEKVSRIAIVSTGDELVDFDETPLEYQIRRSNPYALSGVLRSFGIGNMSTFHIQDNKENVYSSLQEISDNHDIIIISGGVSAGKFDFLPEVLGKLQVEKVFHKIKQKPGKPFWFGHKNWNKLFFALPGNPVSCLVCLRRYLIPMLYKANNLKVKIESDINRNKFLTQFLPVKLDRKNNEIVACVLKTNNSGDYGSLAESEGFVEIPPEGNDAEPFDFYGWRP